MHCVVAFCPEGVLYKLLLNEEIIFERNTNTLRGEYEALSGY